MSGMKNRGAFKVYVFAVMWYIFMSGSLSLRPFTEVAWFVFALVGFFFNTVPSKRNVSKQVGIYFVTAMFFFLTCLYAIDSFQSIRYLIILIMFFFIAYSITNTAEKVEITLKICLGYCIFHGIVTFIQMLMPTLYVSLFLPFLPFPEEIILFMKAGSMSGFSNQTGSNAFFLAFGFGLSFFLIEKRKVLKFILSFLFFVAILATGRRGPTVIAAAIILYLGFEGGFKSWLQRVLLIVFGIILLDLLSDSIPYINNVANKFEELSATEDLLNGRSAIFEYMIELAKERPLFGYGLYSFSDVMSQSGSKILFSHNAYLQYILEVGLIGLSFICVMIISPVIKGLRFLHYKNSKENKMRLCLFVQLLLIFWGFIESSFYDQYRFFLLLLTQLGTLTLIDYNEDCERIEKCPEQIKR